MSGSIHDTNRQSSQNEETANKDIRASRMVDMMMDDGPSSKANSFVFRGSSGSTRQDGSTSDSKPSVLDVEACVQLEQPLPVIDP